MDTHNCCLGYQSHQFTNWRHFVVLQTNAVTCKVFEGTEKLWHWHLMVWHWKEHLCYLVFQQVKDPGHPTLNLNLYGENTQNNLTTQS